MNRLEALLVIAFLCLLLACASMGLWDIAQGLFQ